MRLFIEDLKNRSYLSFIIGLVFLLSAFFCGSFVFFENSHKIPDSISFRVAVSAVSWALTICSLGWMNEYLYKKQTRYFFAVSYSVILVMLWVLSIISVIRGIAPSQQAELPYDRFADLLYTIGESCFMLLMAVNTKLMFTQNKMPVSQHYTWGVRLGYLIFFIPVLMNTVFHLMSSFMFYEQSSKLSFIMNVWERPAGGLRIAYIMGMSALQVIPLSACYVFKKKKEVQVFAVTYFICMILLFIMTLLRQPLLPVQ